MLSSIEYSWPEKLRFSRAAGRSFDLLYADLLSVNLIETVRQVEVPVFFAEGRYDQMAPVEVAERYFSSLIAPIKEWVLFENSAHFPPGKRGSGSTSSSSTPSSLQRANAIAERWIASAHRGWLDRIRADQGSRRGVVVALRRPMGEQ